MATRNRRTPAPKPDESEPTTGPTTPDQTAGEIAAPADDTTKVETPEEPSTDEALSRLTRAELVDLHAAIGREIAGRPTPDAGEEWI